MASKAEAFYKKKMEADKAAAETDFQPAEQYQEDPSIIDATNSVLKTGSKFNKVGANASESEMQAFMKMSDAQKAAYVKKKKGK